MEEDVTIPDASENAPNTQHVDPERTIAESGSRVEKISDGDRTPRPLAVALQVTMVPQAVRTESRVRDGIEEDTEDFVNGLDLMGNATNVHSVSTLRIGQIVVRSVVQEPTPKSREQLIRALIVGPEDTHPIVVPQYVMNVKLDVQLLDVVLHVRVDLQVCVRIMMISKLRKSMDLFDSFWVRIVSNLRPIDVRNNISARACCFNVVTSHHCSWRKVETRSSSPKIQPDQTVRSSNWTVSLPYDRLP